MRTVHVSGRTQSVLNDSTITEQTIDYLKNHIPIMSESLNVVEPYDARCFDVTDNSKGYGERAIGAPSGYRPGPEVTRFDCSSLEISVLDDVRYLLDMIMGWPVSSRTNTWCLEGVKITQSTIASHSGFRTVERWGRFKKIHRLLVRVVHRFGGVAMPYSWLRSIDITALLIPALTPTVAYLRRCQRISRVWTVTVGFAIIVGCLAVAAVANGVPTDRQLRTQSQKRAVIMDAMRNKMKDAAALHSMPGVAANALLLADHLATDPGMPPDLLFEAVGSAVTDVPGIVLDGMIWSPIATNEGFETLAYALGSVPKRDFQGTATSGAATQVELTGRVMGSSLALQKQQLDMFKEALSQLPNIMEVRILDSPVDLALSSDSSGHESALYRLSLRLGGV